MSKSDKQLLKLEVLITQYLEIDDDYNIGDYDELYLILENFLIGRSMLEAPINFGAGGLKKSKLGVIWE